MFPMCASHAMRLALDEHIFLGTQSPDEILWRHCLKAPMGYGLHSKKLELSTFGSSTSKSLAGFVASAITVAVKG
jgi:hypothetical protein